MCIVHSLTSNKKCGQAITNALVAWSGQHLIISVEHIQGAADNRLRWKISCLNKLTTNATQLIFRHYLPKCYRYDYVFMLENWAAIDCFLGFSHEDNIFTTTVQINYSSFKGDKQLEVLGYFSGLNVNQFNDPANSTCLLFFNHLPLDYYPWRFCHPL